MLIDRKYKEHRSNLQTTGFAELKSEANMKLKTYSWARKKKD